MANTNENKKRFLAAQVGMSGNNAYAFHLEGNLTAAPHLMPATEDKPEMCYTSMGIGMGCQKLMARATGKNDPEDEGETFVSLNFYNSMAKKVMESGADKGNAIAVCGRLVPYTDKDGHPRVRVMVDNFVLTFNGKRNGRFSVMSNTFTSKSKGVQNLPMVCLLTGNVIRVDEVATSANGRDYLRGAVGLTIPAKKVYDKASTGKVAESYPDDASSIMNFVVFDEMASRMAKVLKKGETICMTGRVAEDTYEGKTHYTFNPRCVKVMSFPADSNAASGPAASAANAVADANAPVYDTAPAPNFFEMGEEELPF